MNCVFCQTNTNLPQLETNATALYNNKTKNKCANIETVSDTNAAT